MSYSQRYRDASASKYDRFSGVGGMNCSMDALATRAKKPAVPRSTSSGARRVASPATGYSNRTPNAAAERPPFRVTPSKTTPTMDRGFASPEPAYPTRGGVVRSRAVEVRNGRSEVPQRLGNARDMRPPAQQPLSRRSSGNRIPKSPSASSHVSAGALEELSGVFQAKLSSLMVVRQQIEELTHRHKVEEEDLATAVQDILSRQDTSSDEATKAELLATVEERNKAIKMLDVFREEGNAVMTRMHESLRHSHNENEKHLRRIAELTAENERLLKVVQGGESGDRDENGRAVGELNEMLVEMDAIIINLRSHNEALMNTNNQLRERVSLLENTDLGPDENDVDVLKAALRREKQQRMEAEEQSHRLLSEHHKNVSLLEQRLRNTPRAGTPRRASVAQGTPLSPASRSLKMEPSSPLVQLPSGSTLDGTGHSPESSTEIAELPPLNGAAHAEADHNQAVENKSASPQTAVVNLSDDLEGTQTPSRGPSLAHEGVNGPSTNESGSPGGVEKEERSPEAPTTKDDAASLRGTSTSQSRARDATSLVDDHAVNMKELQDIERQLQEVAASLGD